MLLILAVPTVLSSFDTSFASQRASSNAVGKSFKRVGMDLLQILVTLINYEIKNKLDSSPSSSVPSSPQGINDSPPTVTSSTAITVENRSVTPPHQGSHHSHNLLLQKSTKIIGHFARVGRATRPMARFPGFLT